MTIHRTTAVAFRDEHDPHGRPMAAPPPVPCTVSRAEATVGPHGLTGIVVWLAPLSNDAPGEVSREAQVWRLWGALRDDYLSPVKLIASALGMGTAEVAAIVYPPDQGMGEWADDQEPGL